MQNNVIILRLACVLRLLLSCIWQFFGSVAQLRMRTGNLGLGAFSLTADLDSARLDVVSRSLWWGSGVPVRMAPVLQPVRIVACPLNAVPRGSRWHGVPPETFHRWDH